MAASPAPKRRKSSPTKLIAVTTPGSQALARSPARRASYLSPTKASLARFNPNLLPTTTPPRGTFAYQPNLKEARKGPEGQVDEDRDGANAQLSLEITNDVPRTVENAKALGSPAATAVLPAQKDAGEETLIPPVLLYSSPRRLRLRRSMNSSASSQGLRSSPLRPIRQPTLRIPKVNSRVPGDAGDVENVEPNNTWTDGPGKLLFKPKATVVDEERRRKQKERESLREELEALEINVQLFERELMNLKTIVTNDVDSHDVRNLLALTNNANLLPTGHVPEQKTAPLSQLLSSFLPFSRPIPKYKLPPDLAPSPALNPPQSHEAIDLENPIPYLRLFTLLTFTSSISHVSSSASSTHQTHKIQVTGPLNLLRSDLRMTIDTEIHKIASLEIIHLSTWAADELNPWLTVRAELKDVSSICWALDSYWTLCRKRAECWAKCEREFGQWIYGSDGPKVGRETKRGREAVVDNSDGDGEEVSGISTGDLSWSTNKQRPRMTRGELQRNVGKSVLAFRNRNTRLQVDWKIKLDWTGEAESHVKVSAAFPAVWHEADDRKDLSKVPATFDLLVQERGIYLAIKALVELLFS
ncbi:hypothetical protein M501DRAFT_985925 [Patellaria atrata CBS 101060]|uniref:Uncharacterized protein n=1 Tax=Patellaria atrata CBS 101060 TaxID=1346257 RepID=A0A9P4S7U6_9PEZI|nr:hypothetical protein M501DRAFT_985925 [Patellaria atrata CBS 101060]